MKFLLTFLFLIFFSFLNTNTNAEDSEIMEGRICAYQAYNQDGTYIENKESGTFYEILIFADRGVTCKVMLTSSVLDLNYEQYIQVLKNPERYKGNKYGITKGKALTNDICLNNSTKKISNIKETCSKNETKLYLVGGKGKFVYLSKSPSKSLKIIVNKKTKNKKLNKYTLDIIFCRDQSNKEIYPRLRKNKCTPHSWNTIKPSTYDAYLARHPGKKICYYKQLDTLRSIQNRCYPENGIFYVKYSENKFLWSPEILEASATGNELNVKAEDDIAKLEEERKKIEEEKRKLEEEKRKIAEAKKKREEEEKKRKEANAKLYVIGSGTGFFVSSSGHAVSNEHVVGICRKVATKIDGEKVFFNILKTDQVNDLGLIKGDYKSPNFLSIKSDGAEFGEDIVAFGYPLRGILSSSVKLTRGIVSSLSGLNDNYSEIQIDAAIQPGNSGGPVLNMEGQVVGVASSGLNKLAMIEEAEYIPENVNFAVAAPTLHNFLKSNGVSTKNIPLKINNTKELAKIGRPATIQLFCLNTKAKHEELKNKKKHSDVLLEKVIELN